MKMGRSTEKNCLCTNTKASPRDKSELMFIVFNGYKKTELCELSEINKKKKHY